MMGHFQTTGGEGPIVGDGMADLDGPWNNKGVSKTSSSIGEAQCTARGTVIEFTADGAWNEDEIVETSTTVDEAELVGGRSFRRDVGSGRQAVHQRTSSGSTQSSASLETRPGGDHQVTSGPSMTWSRVVATMDLRHNRDWNYWKACSSGWPTF
ncbi:uncharacterized protein C8Q71DRAFT_753548 [Rhodofomes roseus]|uniref:Uncharacterized protein n=1 Tax=Rhodofomes roseus TaxID=34475 RepID=A0ABQ8KI15_9APHY|nr:uncharacterized protein C8Q71DRAFT_753548 [Rhodofomes roseus]KAH9837606.1 hypothetical protein C8Q71DRAFT_753548 [Rhodofomes roseus]